jgi:hypothetical protein
MCGYALMADLAKHLGVHVSEFWIVSEIDL